MGIGTCWAKPGQVDYYGTLDWYRCSKTWWPCYSGMQCQRVDVEVHSTCDGAGYHYYSTVCCIQEC